MIEILQQVQHYKRQPVTLEQYNSWKRDPVYELLILTLADALLEQLDEDLPEREPEYAMSITWQREGARKMLQGLMEWKPVMEEEEDDKATG